MQSLRCLKLSLMLLPACALLSDAALPSADTSIFEALRASDLQLATLGDRIARANVVLCGERQPATGMVLTTIDAIEPAMRDSARAAFGFSAPVIVESVIPGGPAAIADVQANDAILAINAQSLDSSPVSPRASLTRGAAVARRLQDLPPATPIRLTLDRHGQRIERTIEPVASCRGRFELLVSNGWASSTSDDGTTARISSRFLAELPEDAIAVVVAHEFAHLVLRHEQRLTAAGVSGGLLGGFGHNVRYIRQAETQADILSVDLLANAGFPPDAAARFWNGYGRKLSGGMFADRSHPAAVDRAATTAREAAAIAANPDRPKHPPILDSRTQPLDGDWQSILVRAH